MRDIEKRRASNRKWALNNPEKKKENHKRARDKLRALVIEHYGDRCSCCGESEIKFLAIDHINNDGAEQGLLIAEVAIKPMLG